MKRSSLHLASTADAEAPTGAPGRRESNVRQWEPFEIELGAGIEMTNPYVEGLSDNGQAYVKVVFRREGGGARGKQYVAAGFWDGGRPAGCCMVASSDIIVVAQETDEVIFCGSANDEG